MKRITLYVICFMLILFLCSCETEEASKNPAATGATEEASENSSTTETTVEASKNPAATAATEEASDIPPDIEVVYGVTDKIIYEKLQQVEEDATLIIEAVARKTLGQNVSTHYDYEFRKELPGAGYTKWEIEVTKVYKGDVKVEDKLVLLQDYYIWTYSDGKQQLVSATALKPAVKNREYLMFLKYNDGNEGYCPVCDYEGMYAQPSDEIKDKVQAETLEQSDLEVYNYETLHYLVPMYSEVVHKYFN